MPYKSGNAIMQRVEHLLNRIASNTEPFFCILFFQSGITIGVETLELTVEGFGYSVGAALDTSKVEMLKWLNFYSKYVTN